MTPAVLPPLMWAPPPITPLPDVFIDNTPSAWAVWDACVRALDEAKEAA